MAKDVENDKENWSQFIQDDQVNCTLVLASDGESI